MYFTQYWQKCQNCLTEKKTLLRYISLDDNIINATMLNFTAVVIFFSDSEASMDDWMYASNKINYSKYSIFFFVKKRNPSFVFQVNLFNANSHMKRYLLTEMCGLKLG